MIDPVKATMFTNRLAKVFKHKNKLAKRQGVTCYRIYDHDMPEFPFSIELYENNIYIAEYLRRHGMEDDQHEAWLMNCLSIIQQITGVPTDNMYCKQRKRQSHREGQYEKLATEQVYFRVKENGLQFFGITGLIFGPLIISYFLILLKIYYAEYQKPMPVIKKNKSIEKGFKFPFTK